MSSGAQRKLAPKQLQDCERHKATHVHQPPKVTTEVSHLPPNHQIWFPGEVERESLAAHNAACFMEPLWRLIWSLRRAALIFGTIPGKSESLKVRGRANHPGFLSEHLYPRFQGNSLHGVCVEEPQLSASPEGELNSKELLEIKCPLLGRSGCLEDLFTNRASDEDREHLLPCGPRGRGAASRRYRSACSALAWEHASLWSGIPLNNLLIDRLKNEIILQADLGFVQILDMFSLLPSPFRTWNIWSERLVERRWQM